MSLRTISGWGERMNLALFFKVGRVGKFWSGEKPDVLCFPVGGYSGGPLSSVSGNTKKSMGVVGLREGFVLPILRFIGFSEVANSVVRSVPVDVVNAPFWKRSVGVKPCKPMGRVKLSIDLNLGISDGINASGFAANSSLRPSVPFVVEKSSLWIVGKKFAQTFCGNIGSSHDDLSYRLDWLEASLCISTSGLRHFTAYTYGGKA